MNTNMSSAIIGNNNDVVINNGANFTIGTGDLSELTIGWCTYIGDHMSRHGVINALQLLLASNDEMQVADFEAETGWSWRDACTTALEAGTANLLVSMSDAEIAEFEEATGWKWSDAVEESILAGIEAELGTKASNASQSAESKSPNDEFERQTGWKWDDAVDMAAERQREVRLFGARH